MSSRKPPSVLSAVSILLLLALSIFASEFVLMLALHFLGEKITLWSAFVNSVFLVILVTPVLYTLAIAPLFRCIQAHQEQAQRSREEEKRYLQFLEHAPYPVVLHDGDHILWVNSAALELYGTTDPNALVGRKVLEFVDPEFHPQVRQRIEEALAENAPAVTEEKLHLGNNRTIEAEVAAVPVPLGERLVIQVMVRDVTEKKRAEEQIRKSLAEKEILLRELHHRVKNGLQIISSLLALQVSHEDDSALAASLQKSQLCIQTIAKVFDKLYQPEQIGQIDSEQYFPELLSDLLLAYRPPHLEVHLVCQVAPVALDANTCMYLSLILHEWVANSLSHAFPPSWTGERPEIGFSLSVLKKSPLTYQARYWDNGVGITPCKDCRSEDGNKGLGCLLIQALTKQLQGELERFPCEDGGLCYRLTFTPSSGESVSDSASAASPWRARAEDEP